MPLFGRRRRGQLSASDLADYGSVTAGTVNVDAAATGLQVSKREVWQVIKRAEADQRNTLFRRMTGRRGADVSADGSPLSWLQAAFGRGPRGGVVNATAAAKKLGVSPGTVRRWAAGTQQPTPAHHKALQAAARRAATIKAGRRAGTSDFRSSPQARRASHAGSTVWIYGMQGPTGYEREREISDIPIDPDQFESLLRAYEEGGDRDLVATLTDIVGTNYLDDWSILTIEDFGFGRPE
jgi:transposase